ASHFCTPARAQDFMSIRQELLEDLEKRRSTALLGGGKERLESQRSKGQLTARERLDAFFDQDTFQEWGLHVDHACHDFGMEKKSLPCDGVITGIGRVGGRPVAAYSQDATVGGGALGQRHAKKICDVMDYALECGVPF